MTFPSDHNRLRRILEALLTPDTVSRGDSACSPLADRLIERACAPLAYQYAREQELERWMEALETTWRRHTIRVTALRQKLADTLEWFHDDIPVAVLKGEPLARQLFGDPLARTSRDIDLLVAPEHIEPLCRRAEAHGYQRKASSSWSTNQVALDHPDTGVRLELHWQLAPPPLPVPETASVLRRTDPMTFEGIEIPVLDPETTLLHLCYHFHQHQGFLKGLLDIAGWLDRFEDEIDTAALRRRAERIGIENLVQWPLWTLWRWLEIDSELRRDTSDFAVHAWSIWNARHLQRRYVELEDASSILARWRESGEGPFDKLASVWSRALSMTVIDGGWPDKLRAFGYPIVLGSHALGRTVARWTGRDRSLSDLDAGPECTSRGW